MKRIMENHAIRYIFFGILSTLVNFGVFAMLKTWAPFPITVSNIISILCAMLFAYVVNAKYVFFSKARTVSEILKECMTFMSARLITMFIEVFGVWLLAEVWLWDVMISKVLINVIVLILNYVFSKWLFKK